MKCYESELALAPRDYERKQTLVNEERFTTPELKEYESKILDAQEKIVDIERGFCRIALGYCRRRTPYPPDRARARRGRCPGGPGA